MEGEVLSSQPNEEVIGKLTTAIPKLRISFPARLQPGFGGVGGEDKTSKVRFQPNERKQLSE